jgi:DNA-binding winged helix-turn-helix (wHTH) protein/TolB-like protein/Tfp pilus assembly protein PilF
VDEIRLGSRTLQPRRQLLVNGRREPIGKRALDILSVLAEARGEIVTKDELLEAVWPGVTVEENALQVHIVALRKALGPEAERLRTIRGVGYQLAIDGDAEPPATAEPRVPYRTVTGEREASESLSPQPAATPPRVTRRLLAGLAVLVALVGFLGVVWWTAGSSLGLRQEERIPVVVRELTATSTDDPTEVALASGITDELIIRLRRVAGLRIGTAGPQGSSTAGPFAGAHIVDGTIRRSGERLRVTARLLSAEGEVLWSDTFDRPFADLLEVQETIAAAIADTLSVSLDVGANSTDFGGTDNPEAFAAYLQGMAHRLDFGTGVARSNFERAVSLDPNFVKAHVEIMVQDGVRLANAGSAEEATRLLARLDDTSRRALGANPDLWIGHYARALYHLQSRDLASADREMKRAVALDPGDDPDLPNALRLHELIAGRADKADAAMRTATLVSGGEADASSLIQGGLMQGRYEEVLSAYDKLPASEQRAPVLINNVTWALILSGRPREAIELLERSGFTSFLRLIGAFDPPPNLSSLSDGELQLWAGRNSNGSQSDLAHLALHASHQGQPVPAVRMMRLAFEKPGSYQLFYLWHPAFARARRTEEFVQLVTDLGFVKMWRESGEWSDFCRPASSGEITCT